MSEKKIKVLYLFAGERKKLERAWERGDMPDSFFIGFNHLKDFGVDASYIENKFLNLARKKNYNLTNLFLIFVLCRYDVVFSGASLLLPFVVKVILRLNRPKFVWYNTFFTNAINRNQDKPIRLWAIKKTICCLDAVVCPSTAQRQFLIDQGFDASKFHFIPNGIDVEFMTKPRTSVETSGANEPFILSVGKDMGRDYVTFAEAVRGLDIKVKVAALPRNFADVKDLPKNLEILGFVPFVKLLELYKRASIIVIPTKSEKHMDASDCSGQYALLDAMSLGRPIIASRRQTLVDYFVDGEEGIIVPPEDPVKLREAIKDLLSDKAKAEGLGEKASKKAEQIFTTKRLASDLASLFKKTAK